MLACGVRPLLHFYRRAGTACGGFTAPGLTRFGSHLVGDGWLRLSLIDRRVAINSLGAEDPYQSHRLLHYCLLELPSPNESPVLPIANVEGALRHLNALDPSERLARARKDQGPHRRSHHSPKRRQAHFRRLLAREPC